MSIDRNVFRLRAWTHISRKAPKGEKPLRSGLISMGCKAGPGQHAVMLLLGSLGEGEELTRETIEQMLRGNGLRLAADAEIANTEGDKAP